MFGRSDLAVLRLDWSEDGNVAERGRFDDCGSAFHGTAQHRLGFLHGEYFWPVLAAQHRNAPVVGLGRRVDRKSDSGAVSVGNLRQYGIAAVHDSVLTQVPN